MRHICAWCGVNLADDAGKNVEAKPISHGICPACAGAFTANDKGMFRTLLDSFAAPILVVDSGGAILAANTTARVAFGNGGEDIQGLLQGEPLQCARARHPGGCGGTRDCAGCEVRASIEYTAATGIPLCMVETSFEVATSRGVERRRVHLSTEKIGAAVMVRLDRVVPEEAGELGDCNR